MRFSISGTPSDTGQTLLTLRGCIEIRLDVTDISQSISGGWPCDTRNKQRCRKPLGGGFRHRRYRELIVCQGSVFVGGFDFGNTRINAPLGLRQAQVVVVAPAGIGLGCGEELGGLCGILLEYGGVAHLAL